VNRPFSAFTALITLLALAMFAVSSTTRSTTVQPVARTQRLEMRGRKSLIASRQPAISGKATFVTTGDHSFVAAKTPASLTSLPTRGQTQRLAMRQVRIMTAENFPAADRNCGTADCQSHADAYYDLVVYGIKAASPPMAAVEMDFEPTTVNLRGELDAIFQDLASRQSKDMSPPAGAMNKRRRALRWSALVAAIREWMKYQIHATSQFSNYVQSRQQLAESGFQVTWAEYSEFADGAVAGASASAEMGGTLDTKNGVRSSDWLRHFAASGLYQLSLVLQAAAKEVEAPGQRALSSLQSN